MSTKHPDFESTAGPKRNNIDISPFDELASEYDAWFEEEGKLIFAIEVRAFQEILPYLPKPWLEIGVGSGRFAQALGIETGIDPSFRLSKWQEGEGLILFWVEENRNCLMKNHSVRSF